MGPAPGRYWPDEEVTVMFTDPACFQFITIPMTHPIKHADGPTNTETQETQIPPALCEHQYEVIAHEDSGDLRRCAKCGSLETE